MSTTYRRAAPSKLERPLVWGVRAAFVAYRLRRQEYRATCALLGLSDGLLKDMGIARSQAREFVRGCYTSAGGDDESEMQKSRK